MAETELIETLRKCTSKEMGAVRNCERHHFSLASASMEYTLKNNLPLVSQWTQDIWTKFCSWLMDESEPDAIVLEEGGWANRHGTPCRVVH